MSLLSLKFKVVLLRLWSVMLRGQSSFNVLANSLTLKLYLRLWSVILRGVNPLLMSLLTVNFKIVPVRLWSVILGVNHLSISLLTLMNFKIVPETLVSDTGGSIIFQCPC